MTDCTRRTFGCLVGVGCVATLGARVARAQAKARVVVIGGGVGGATAAKYLALSARELEITLVEPRPRYTTCFFSNLYLAGLRSFASLTHGYEAAGAAIRHQNHSGFCRGDRSGGQDCRPGKWRQALLRSPHCCSRHRLQVRCDRGLR